MSVQPSQTPLKGIRKRSLNVIYFIDSAKTKTLKFSLKASYIFIAGLLLTVVWSGVSTYLLYNSYAKSFEQSQRIETLLSTVFAYQTRYDGIYEKAYPDQDPIADDRPSDSGATVAGTAPRKALSAKSDPNKKVQTATTAQSAPVQAAAEPSGNKGIDIDQIVFKQSPTEILLSFAIKNLDRPERTHGYVVGTAEFITDAGKTLRLTSPAKIDVAVEQKTRNLPRDHRFAIKYYTKKTLRFTPPPDVSGRFERVTIQVRSKDNPIVEENYSLAKDQGRFTTAAPESGQPTGDAVQPAAQKPTNPRLEKTESNAPSSTAQPQ